MSRRRRERRRRGKKGKKCQFLERAGWTNRHHLVPKARGGTWSADNIFMWDERRHAAFHLLFGLMTFPEAARLLLRAWNMKKKQRRYWTMMEKVSVIQCTECKRIRRFGKWYTLKAEEEQYAQIPQPDKGGFDVAIDCGLIKFEGTICPECSA